MRNRYHLLIFSGTLLAVLWIVFSWLHFHGAAPIPQPSHNGGYYDEPFLLELHAPSTGTIYYTTDGSTPTADSAVYDNGILISGRSQEPNRYTSIQNVITDWGSYTPTSDPVEKGTVIRAIFVNDWGISSDIFTQSYFVGLEEPQKGYTLSLIFEDEVLYGTDGIFVTGKEYDQWYLSGDTSAPAPLPNFEKRMEAAVVSQVYDGSSELLSQPVSMRIQGNSTRNSIKKRLILEAYSELSGSNLFSSQLFPNTSSHSLMTKDCALDAMVYELVSDRSVALQQSVPVRIFFNGEYYFDTHFLERFDNQYFREHYDVDNVMLVKSGNVDEDITINADAYAELMYWVEYTDFSDEVQWAALNQEVVLQSYMDFMAINCYLCNWDFSDDKNHLMWRSVSEESSPYADERWRWCIYDVDAMTLTYRKYDVDSAAQLNIFSCDLPYSDVRINETVFFKSLKKNADFCKQFVLTFLDIMNNNFAAERVSRVLQQHSLTLDWENGFFRDRPAYAAAHLAEEFSLDGTLETVSISTSQPDMGSIQVNTSIIDLSTGSWTGRYFTDYPITVTAAAKDGYEFIGWKGYANTQDPAITVNVDGGVSLDAVFAKIE